MREYGRIQVSGNPSSGIFYVVKNIKIHYKPPANVSTHFTLMMMVMMNCFCGMVNRRKTFGLVSNRDHCQRSSPSRISNTPRAGFEPAQNLSSGFVEWSCAVVITTTPRRHWWSSNIHEHIAPSFRSEPIVNIFFKLGIRCL